LNNELDDFKVFPWSDNFSTGIPIVDEQHKKILDLLNQLTNFLIDDNEVELNRVFDELTTYASYHFETEEKIWLEYFKDDPWFSSHLDSHTSFLPTVEDLKDKHRNKPLRENIENIVKFLIRWLTLHILDSDKRMAIVLHKMEDGATLSDAKKLSDEEMSTSSRVLIDTVLNMYDELSSRTLDLMRERIERKKAQNKLNKANKELEKLAITDQLTGLFNRRHFNDVFEQELRRAIRDKSPLSFIMFDIDHFKKLNDHYGHLKGDIALKKVSERLLELCRRPGDFVFRLGGEEFGILIADQTAFNAIDFAETLRKDIENLYIPNVMSDISEHLTISAGLITRTPTETDSVETFMHTADTRLYRAKTQGRNQIISSD